MTIAINLNPTDVLSQAQSNGKLSALESLRGQGVTSGDQQTDEQLMGLAVEFEKIMLQQLMSAMRKTVQSDGLFGESLGGDVYLEMFDSAVIDQSAGNISLGLAEPLYRQLIATKGDAVSDSAHDDGTPA